MIIMIIIITLPADPLPGEHAGVSSGQMGSY